MCTTMPIAFVIGLLIISSAPAHAYIDPGSGSYMLQIGLAGILAALFTLKTQWHRLRERTAVMIAAHSHGKKHNQG